MSGTKYINLTDREWRETQNRLTVLANENAANRQRLEQERSNAQNRYNQLQMSHQREIANLNEQLQNQLRRAEKDREEQRNRMTTEMNGLRNQIAQMERKEQETLEQFNQRMEQQWNRYNDLLQQEISGVEQRVGAKIENEISRIHREMENQNKTKIDIANFWLSQFEILANNVATNNRHHEQYRPGRMNEFLTQFGQARSMVNNAPEAALALILNQFSELNLFRNELRVYEDTWMDMYNTASEALTVLQNRYDSVRDTITIKNQENNTETQIDANYWTEGAINRIESKINELVAQLGRQDNLRIQDMQVLINSSSQIQNEINQQENCAKERFAQSLCREEMMQRVKDAFQRNGWEVLNVRFKDDEEKDPILLRLRKIGSKDEIVLTIDHERITSDNWFLDNVGWADLAEAQVNTIVLAARAAEANQTLDEMLGSSEMPEIHTIGESHTGRTEMRNQFR